MTVKFTDWISHFKGWGKPVHMDNVKDSTLGNTTKYLRSQDSAGFSVLACYVELGIQCMFLQIKAHSLGHRCDAKYLLAALGVGPQGKNLNFNIRRPTFTFSHTGS